MTFKKFLEIFKTKYPEGDAWSHGEFAQSGGKVAVVYKAGGKVYFHRGAYDRILEHMGFKVINKFRVDEMKRRLQRLRETNGTLGFGDEIMDYTEEIKETESMIEDIEKNWIVF